MDLLRNAACSRSDNRYGSLPSSVTLPIDGSFERPEDVQERALAAAGRTHDRHGIATRDAE